MEPWAKSTSIKAAGPYAHSQRFLGEIAFIASRSFEYGSITLATGYSPEEKVMLNYNKYFLQMDMISMDGDTLQVKPIRELKLVTMGADQFYHDYQIGYLEILYQGLASLGVLNYLHTDKLEAHSTGRPGRISATGNSRGVPSDYDRYYKLMSTYYFLDVENKPVKATRRTIVNLFKRHKAAINAYVEDTHINFSKENDLVRLLTFCDQLDKPSRKSITSSINTCTSSCSF